MVEPQRNALFKERQNNRSKFGFQHSRNLKWRRAGPSSETEVINEDSNEASDDELEAAKVPTVHAVNFAALNIDIGDVDMTHLTLFLPLFVRGAGVSPDEVYPGRGSYYKLDENYSSGDSMGLVFDGTRGICDIWANSLALSLVHIKVPNAAVSAVGTVVSDILESFQKELYNVGPIELTLKRFYQKENLSPLTDGIRPISRMNVVCMYDYINKRAISVLNSLSGKIMGLLTLISKRYLVPMKSRRGSYALLEVLMRKYDATIGEEVLNKMKKFNSIHKGGSADVCATTILLRYTKQLETEGCVRDTHNKEVAIKWNPEG